jgi:hypothetical protein
VSVTGNGLVNSQSGGTVPGSGGWEALAEARGVSRVGSGEGSVDVQPVTRMIIAIAARRLTAPA